MRYVLILLGLMFANVASAMDCEKVPTCEELGYSTESDPNCADDGYMYCPFDKEYKACVQYNCAALGFTESDKSSWCNKLIKCQGNPRMTLCQNMCEVGDVYYADGTCGYANDYDSTKIPVGVVFYVTDEGRHGKVVSLHELTFDENDNFNPENPFGQSKREPHFGLYNVKPQMKGFASAQELISALQSPSSHAFAGLENTEILISTKPTNEKCLNGVYKEKTLDYNKNCQATMALAAHNFYPPKVERTNPITGQGKWYMPSVGEIVLEWNSDMSKLEERNAGSTSWWSIKNNVTPDVRDKVDQTLQALKDKNVQVDLLTQDDHFQWSSSYLDETRYLAFLLYPRGTKEGIIAMDGAGGDAKPVRPILAF